MLCTSRCRHGYICLLNMEGMDRHYHCTSHRDNQSIQNPTVWLIDLQGMIYKWLHSHLLAQIQLDKVCSRMRWIQIQYANTCCFRILYTRR